MEITRKLAEYLVATDFDSLPPDAITAAKRAILDTLGVTYAGSTQPAGKIITDFVEKDECKPVCGVIGGRGRTSAANAALANGTMAHALDYDDASRVQGHISSVLLPTVLAQGEEIGCSGKEIIAAFVLGAEIWGKISANMPALHFKGWHPTGVFGPFGATAAAAKLLRLNAEQTRMALGLAGSQAAGVSQNFGTMTKPFHVGNASRIGIVSASLAKSGFTATRDILEGSLGFPVGFYWNEAVELPRMTKNLGNPFNIVSPGFNVKKFPTCYMTHRAIDALLDLVEEYDLRPADVEHIDCQGSPRAVKMLFYTDPQNSLEGKFSMHFCLAVALAERKIGLAQVTDEKVKDPRIVELARKVTFRVNPDADEMEIGDKRPDVVTVKLKNGGSHSKGVLTAKGHAEVPLTWDELVEKYRECACQVLDDKDIEKSVELVANLEDAVNIRELLNLAISR
jgi:2-methylcitrate dehydratase PrpD